jgi:DNA-binding NarL/FixJ family response regulator
MKTTIFIIEDDPDFGKVLQSLLGTNPFFEIAGIATTITGAKAHIDKSENEIYLVDLTLPDGNGIQVMQHIRIKYPRAKILALSTLGDEKHIINSIQAGASGYLLKSEMPANITQSIISLINGDGYLSGHASKIIIKRFFSDFLNAPVVETKPQNASILARRVSDLQCLTRKENEILKNAEIGSQAKVIADNLNISIFTVNQHLRSIYRKLNVRNKMEAVQEARRQGLI